MISAQFKNATLIRQYLLVRHRKLYLKTKGVKLTNFAVFLTSECLEYYYYAQQNPKFRRKLTDSILKRLQNYFSSMELVQIL